MTFFCVCVIDMVNSTNTIATIKEPNRVASYYSIYLNALGGIAEHFGGKIIKNAGDALIIYFPKTIDSSNHDAFKEVLTCCFAMKQARSHINSIMQLQQLPPVSYRISADYGLVEATKSKTSMNEDLFGSTMNLCTKMNAKASINGIIIGGDLYQIFKSHGLDRKFVFEDAGAFSIGLKSAYPVYSVFEGYKDMHTLSRSHDFSELIDLDGIVDEALDNETAVSCIPNERKNNDTFPSILQSASEVTNGKISNDGNSPKQGGRILLIDDDIDILATYVKMLSVAGFEVDSFDNPQQALNAFALKCTLRNKVGTPQPKLYDMVITDIRMPGINGLELYRIFKLLDGNVKIVLVTALDILDELKSMIPEIRMEQVIRKPIERNVLLGRVKTILAE